MASIIVNSQPFVAYWPQVIAECYVKSAWSDQWVWEPRLYVDTLVEAASPSESRGEFRWEYGIIRWAGASAVEEVFPAYASDLFIAVNVYDYWGEAPLWVGIIRPEVDSIGGGQVALATGTQRFTAYGLESVLDRMDISQAYTAVGWIDRPFTFNRRSRRGQPVSGNRSASPASNGAYMFAGENEWSALDVVNYLLANYINTGSIQWVLDGQVDALDNFVEEWDFDGMTVKQALDALIDRRRGFGWRVLADPTPGSPIRIWVYSQFAAPLSLSNSVVWDNPYKIDLDFTGHAGVRPEITLNNLAQYDGIDVRGGPVRTCFTVSYADGTLEPGWTTSQETAYGTGGTGTTEEEKDGERSSDTYRAVYQLHRVPLTWNFTAGDGEGGTKRPVSPGFDPIIGYFDTALSSPTYMPELVFDRQLPILFDEDAGAFDVEYRDAFALIAIDGVWYYLSELDNADRRPARLTMADGRLAVWTEVSPNHVMGLNHFTDTTTNTDPQYDYEDMLVTVSMKTDVRLRIRTTLGVQSAQTRWKLIDVPDAEAWYVLQGTVLDIEDNALVKSDGEWLRNDIARLYDVATLAAEWYLRPRMTLKFTTPRIHVECPVGALVNGVRQGYRTWEIGTIVSRRTWRFSRDQQTTEVETGHSELDVVESIGRGAKRGY